MSFRSAVRCPPALIAVMLLVLTSCNRDDSDETPPSSLPPPATVLRMAVDALPDNLDPLRASSAYSNLVIKAIFETPFRYDPDARPYRLVPALAAAQPDISADGLHYTFGIREGARFNDSPAFADGVGRPVSAQDLVYSIKRHLRPDSGSQGAWLWEDHIEGVEQWRAAGADPDTELSGLAVDEQGRVHIRLRAPYPHLLHSLATGFAAVVPREAVEQEGQDFARRPVGSGVFRLAERSDTQLALDRVDGAGADPLPAGQGVARVELHALADPVARWRALRAGGVDLIEVPATHVSEATASLAPLQLHPELASDHEASLDSEAGFVFIALNHANPQLGGGVDVDAERAHALRCALATAYDWEQRNREFHAGLGRTFRALRAPLLYPTAHASDAANDSVDAATWLRRGGWEGEAFPHLVYGAPAGNETRQIFELFRGRLLALGIPQDRIELRIFPDFGSYMQAVAAGELDLMELGWSLDFPDALSALQLFHGAHIDTGMNPSRWQDAAFDRAFDSARSMAISDPGRDALVETMQQRLEDECAAISGLSRQRLHLWSRNFQMRPDSELIAGDFFARVRLRVRDQ